MLPCSLLAKETRTMIANRVFFTTLFLGVVATCAPAADVPEISSADFDRLLAAIKPQKGESPWREIAWLTNVTEARKKASAENKPLVIFTAADGSPLSRT
jgi:hypothetical protein